MCWTVVEGVHSLAEIAVRVSGRPELEGPRDIHELPQGEKLTVSAGLVPPAVVLFEAGGFLGSHPPVLKRLSTDSDVYSVFWDIDGNNYLSRASQGRLLTRLDVTEPEEWPDGCEEAWPELRHLHQADQDDWQATALAVVELSTGRRLTREWLREPHHFFQVTWPLTYENATPPPSRATGGFGTPAGLMESVIADFEFGDFLVAPGRSPVANLPREGRPHLKTLMRNYRITRSTAAQGMLQPPSEDIDLIASSVRDDFAEDSQSQPGVGQGTLSLGRSFTSHSPFLAAQVEHEMFELLSKLAEIFSSYGQQYFTGRRGAKDARVAQCLLDVILTLQELVARGERILLLAEEPDEEFADQLERQIDGLEALRTKLEGTRALLTTIDVEFYLDLVVFIDVKSGLLTRWAQQARRSAYSTTTLFFLPPEDLDAALESGRSHANAQGMELDRSDYLLVLAERLAQVRATEIRDIRRKSGAELGPEIGAARTRLDGARKLCRTLLESMEQTLGAEALARLRRDLAH